MTVGRFLTDSATAHPDREALVRGQERLTYGRLAERVARLGSALIELGLAPGERVVIHLDDPLATVVAVFATLRAGAVFVIVNPLLTPRKLAAVLADCTPSLVLTSSAAGRAAAAAAASVRVLLGDGGPAPESPRPSLLALDLTPVTEGSAITPPPAEGPDDRVCALIYTSGSTGTPKGVTVSHRNVVAAADSILAYLDIAADDTVLDLLPLASDYGLYNILMPLRRGARVILDRPFVHPAQLVAPINEEGVTGLPLTPTVVAILRRFRGLGLRHPERVRWVTSTGQALPPAHSRWLGDTFPAARIFSMYGVTECKRVSYLPPEELPRRPTSVGRAIPGTEVRLVDGHGAPITRAGEEGELQVRGDHVMLGYWGRPEATAEVLVPEPDGGGPWLCTGDLFTRDEEGWLVFVGRRDRLIKSGGQRVSPREVEDAVNELVGVCEAAAVVVDHPVLGQALRLLVVADEGVTVAAVRAHCERCLERFSVPREIELRPALPRTAAGKVDHLALAAEAAPGPAGG